MGTVQPAYRHDLVTICCGKCGIEFAVPDRWQAEKQKTREGWYCPNGHSRVYVGTTEEQKKIADLEQALARERSTREWAESQKRSADIRRGKAEAEAKRLLKRANAGVCPHCHRTVGELAAHIATKHPTHAPDPAGSLP